MNPPRAFSPSLAVSAGTLLAIAPLFAAGPATDTRPAGPVDWTGDVRPAIEAVLCVVPAPPGAADRLAFEVYPQPGCPAPVSLHPALRELAGPVSERLMQQDWLLIDLWDSIRKTVPADAGQQSVQTQLRERVVSEPRLQAWLMPSVHSFLAARGLTCTGCPGSAAPEPPRSVTLDTVLPYAAAHVWPDSLEPPYSIGMHICTGANGLSRIPHADLELARAGFEAVRGNSALLERVSAAMGEVLGSDEYKAALGAGVPSGLEEIRSGLANRLIRDEGFRSAVAARLVETETGSAIRCTDCREQLRKHPPPAPSDRDPRNGTAIEMERDR